MKQAIALVAACLLAGPLLHGTAQAQSRPSELLRPPPPAAPSYRNGQSEEFKPFVAAPPHRAGTYCYTMSGWCIAEPPGAVSGPCTCPGTAGGLPRKGTLH